MIYIEMHYLVLLQVISALAKSPTVIDTADTVSPETDRISGTDLATNFEPNITDSSNANDPKQSDLSTSAPRTHQETNSLENITCDSSGGNLCEAGYDSGHISLVNICDEDKVVNRDYTVGSEVTKPYYDKDCSECQITRRDPTPAELTMCLHALSYKVRWSIFYILESHK